MTTSTKGAIIGGCIGIAVMFTVIESNLTNPVLVFVLWPSSIFGVGYGLRGGLVGLIVGALEVGVQFLAYAAAGWVVGAVVRIARREG